MSSKPEEVKSEEVLVGALGGLALGEAAVTPTVEVVVVAAAAALESKPVGKAVALEEKPAVEAVVVGNAMGGAGGGGEDGNSSASADKHKKPVRDTSAAVHGMLPARKSGVFAFFWNPGAGSDGSTVSLRLVIMDNNIVWVQTTVTGGRPKAIELDVKDVDLTKYANACISGGLSPHPEEVKTFAAKVLEAELAIAAGTPAAAALTGVDAILAASAANHRTFFVDTLGVSAEEYGKVIKRLEAGTDAAIVKEVAKETKKQHTQFGCIGPKECKCCRFDGSSIPLHCSYDSFVGLVKEVAGKDKAWTTAALAKVKTVHMVFAA